MYIYPHAKQISSHLSRKTNKRNEKEKKMKTTTKKSTEEMNMMEGKRPNSTTPTTLVRYTLN
eukprot:m.38595 g.38595  ORF g.38595 m.38595 type:complete len:62 (+) comp11497_c1_seq1:209-394(+)